MGCGNFAARLPYAKPLRTGYTRVDRRLTHAYQSYIYMHMRTTLILDDRLVEQARRLTGIAEKTALVHAGLQALIAREAARRLAALAGTMPDLEAAPRRRSARRRR